MSLFKNLTFGLLRLTSYLVLTVAAVLVIAVTVIGGTQTGSKWLADTVSDLISGPDQMIALSDVSGLFTGQLRVGTITVGDSAGPYAKVEGLQVDWSPLKLLSLRFDASAVSATAVTLSRKPVPPTSAPPPPPKGHAPFSLPVSIHVDRVSVPSIVIGEAVMGTPAHLALQGNVAADSNAIDSGLRINQVDRPDAALTAQLSFAPEQNRLDLNAGLQEPQGGVLVTLLQLPGQPALAISLTGGGPLSNWKASLKAALDGQPRLTLDATHQTIAGGRTISLTGAGAFDSLMPPDVRSLFAGDTRLQLAATLRDSGAVTISSGLVETASLSLLAQGTYDPQGQNDLTATLSGKAGPVTLRLPLADGTVAAELNRFALSLNGRADAARLQARLDATSLTLPQGRFGGIVLDAQAPAFNLAEPSGEVDTSLTVQQIALVDPALARAVQAPMTVKAPLQLSRTRVVATPLTLESPGAGGTIDASYEIADHLVKAGFRLFVVPTALPPPWDARLKGMVKLEGEASRDGAGALAVPNFALTSSLVDVDGKLSLADQILSANASGTVKDLAALDPNVAGSATFSAEAKGPFSALQASADVAIADATLAGRRLANFDLAAKATLDPAAPVATVTARGSLDSKPVQIALDMTSKNGVTRLPKLNLTVGSNRMTGALDVSSNFLPSGQLDFTFPDLGLLAALGGQTAEGDLAGSIRLEDRNGKLATDIKASGKGIRRDSLQVSAPLIDVRSDDLKSLALDGSVKAERIATAGTLFESPALTFSRSGARTTMALSGRYDRAPLTGKAVIDQTGDRLAIALQSLSAVPRGIPVQLAAPATIRVEQGGAIIDGMTVRIGSGSLTLAGRAGQQLALKASIQALPAALANAFAPALDAAGLLSGTVEATGPAGNPKVVYNLKLDGAAVAQTKSAGLSPLQITAAGDYAGGRVSLQGRVTGDGGLDIKAGGTVGLTGARPLDMTVTAALPFAAAQGILSKQGLVAEGQGNANITVGGSVASPQISGAITARGAKLTYVKQNVAIQGIQVDIALTGDRAVINSITGRVTAGGQLSVTGSVDLKSPGLPADIATKLERLTYVDANLVTAVVSGTLGLKGPLLSGPMLSGRLVLDKTSVTIPSRLPSSISQLDIKHRKAPAAVNRQKEALTPPAPDQASTSPIGLDLQISAPSQIFVRGRGIDAELNGDIGIKGTAADPQVSGGFVLKRGRVVILTKRLDFTSGKITFGGGLVPIIDFVATTTSGSTALTATIAGVASDPSITFSSAPALPQDEILAQLVFGQSMSKLSPLQIAQLADAVGQLAGGGTSSSLFGSLRNAVGVDDLDVGTDEKGNASVSAGKYLNDKTYLEFQQSSEGSKAVINLDVGKGFKLKGTAGASGSTGGGVFYEKEY